MRRGVAGLLAGAFVLGAAPLACAADLPVKIPVYKAPQVQTEAPANWTGWYVGLAGGAGAARAEQSDDTPFTSGRYAARGGLIGGTLGTNWQSGPVVYGLETDLAYAHIKGTTPGTDPVFGPCLGIPSHCDSTIRALGTVRGRIGLASQAMLPYITGGLAYANIKGSEGDSLLTGGLGAGSKWVVGWTVGAGLEGVVVPHWTARIEYLYVDLGRHAVFVDTFANATAFPQSIRETAHVVRVGINYHLAGP